MDRPFAITVDASADLASIKGAWRTQRPLYVDRLPPCNDACPAGENVQGWLYHAESGDYEAAWRALVVDNPLPAVMGRVCHHPCEGACNRARMDCTVGIHSIERFLGDEALHRGWKFDSSARSSGSKVLVVGAGPSGWSAAYHLRRMGHAVKIVDADPMAGGMTRFDVSNRRLPRGVLEGEVARIVEMGVELELGRTVGDLRATMDAEGCTAAFVDADADTAAMTGFPGLFAVDAMAPSERTVTAAIGQGRKVARRIDAWLRGMAYCAPPKHEIAGFDKLNPWYYVDAPKTLRPILELARRTSTIDEVVGGFNETSALFEARRCLSCGNCFECDNCYGMCPDNAVVKLGPGRRYEFDFDYCKGCGICVSECPCGAIVMVPETI